MFMLPDLTPRDSHSLWYVPSRGPVAPPPVNNPSTDPNGATHRRAPDQAILKRTALHQLAKDELFQARRKQNAANWGSYHLKPPGVHKTLHQLREEKREHEEHQEVMRREQLAQELIELEGMPVDDGMNMDDVQLDGAQDLDDEVPDADDFYMGADDDDDDDDDEEEEEDNEEGDYEDEDEDEEEADEEAIREERRNDLMAARMRTMADDAFREALIRGDPDGDDLYGDLEEAEEEGQGHMLDENDFVNSTMFDGEGGDMGADLDDDIPEAESGGYEHTDSEAELSSSEPVDSDPDENDEDGTDHMSFAPRATPQGPPSPTPRSVRANLSGSLRLPPGSRQSLGDMSSFLSHDEGSFMNSSPAGRRPAR